MLAHPTAGEKKTTRSDMLTREKAACSLHARLDSLDNQVYHLLDPAEPCQRAGLLWRCRAIATQPAQDGIAPPVVLVRLGSPMCRVLGSKGALVPFRCVRHDIGGRRIRGRVVGLEADVQMVAQGDQERVVASSKLGQRQPLVVCVVR